MDALPIFVIIDGGEKEKEMLAYFISEQKVLGLGTHVTRPRGGLRGVNISEPRSHRLPVGWIDHQLHLIRNENTLQTQLTPATMLEYCTSYPRGYM